MELIEDLGVISVSTIEKNLVKIRRYLSSNNTSGENGIHYITRDKVWIVVENFHNKRTIIGRYKTKKEAISGKKEYYDRKC